MAYIVSARATIYIVPVEPRFDVRAQHEVAPCMVVTGRPEMRCSTSILFLSSQSSLLCADSSNDQPVTSAGTLSGNLSSALATVRALTARAVAAVRWAWRPFTSS